VRAVTGDPRGGIEDAELALRLSPRDPFAYSGEMALAFAYFDLADYDRASLHLRRALDLNPDFVPARAGLAISALARGDGPEAAAEVKWLAERFAAPPAVVLSGIADVLPPGPVYDKWQATLRQAGLLATP
jgi:Flp pilus assembly protein TadD